MNSREDEPHKAELVTSCTTPLRDIHGYGLRAVIGNKITGQWWWLLGFVETGFDSKKGG